MCCVSGRFRYLFCGFVNSSIIVAGASAGNRRIFRASYDFPLGDGFLKYAKVHKIIIKKDFKCYIYRFKNFVIK